MTPATTTRATTAATAQGGTFPRGTSRRSHVIVSPSPCPRERPLPRVRDSVPLAESPELLLGGRGLSKGHDPELQVDAAVPLLHLAVRFDDHVLERVRLTHDHDRVQTVSEVYLELRPQRGHRAREGERLAKPHAEARDDNRVRRRVVREPGTAAIEERDELDVVGIGLVLDDRHPRLDRADERIVPDERVLAVAPDREPAADGGLLEGEERSVRKLQVGSDDQLAVQDRQSLGPLELPEPREELTVRYARIGVYRRAQRVQAK